MLSDHEKKEMLADGLSRERREDFLAGERKKPKSSRGLNDYLAFLTAMQKIRPFEHKRVVTRTERNLL